MIYQKKLSRGEIEKIQCYVTPGLRLQGIAAVKQTTGADIVINAALFDMKKNPTAIYSPFIATAKNTAITARGAWPSTAMNSIGTTTGRAAQSIFAAAIPTRLSMGRSMTG